jgi:hypothetical protein
MKDHIWLPLEQENQQSFFKKRKEKRKEKTIHHISMLLTKDRMERRVSATRKIYSLESGGVYLNVTSSTKLFFFRIQGYGMGFDLLLIFCHLFIFRHNVFSPQTNYLRHFESNSSASL